MHSREKTAQSTWSGWRFWLIPAAGLLLAALALLAAGFGYAKRISEIDTIYPNVTVNGVNVGGMTAEEAANILGDDPNRYENAAVTVNFSTGETVTVTAQDLGLEPVSGAGAAQEAYRYGRGGSMLDNLKNYRACEKEPVQLTYTLAAMEPDAEIISAMVAPVAQQIEDAVRTTQAEIHEDDITIVKNMGAVQVDVEGITQQICQAFLTENYGPIDYEVAPAETENGENGQDQTGEILQTLYDAVFKEPADAYYDETTRTTVEGVQGVRFDMDGARSLWEAAAVGDTVVIPLIKEDPEITSDMVVGEFYTDVLAEKSTSLAGSSSARINNITLAAAALNGVTLQPGEEFNYNQCLGQRTAAKGYQEAGVYSNGKHDTAIGGGICQASSTLYYCALYANLRITERHNHYFLVNYLPRGLDATVSWGWPEFKFKNSRNYPIKIEAWVSGGYLTVRLLGTDEDGSYVVMTSDTWEDAQKYYARTYRNVYDKDGNLISSNVEALSDYYKEEAQTATPTPAPTQPPAAQEQPPVTQEQAPVVQPETPVTQPEAPAPEPPVEVEAAPPGAG